MKTKVTIFQNKKDKQFYWHASRKGRIIADGGEGYKRIGHCLRMIRSIFEKPNDLTWDNQTTRDFEV